MANLVLLLQTLLNKIAAESGLSIPAGQVPYRTYSISSSVGDPDPDPDPQNPHFSGPPGSGSISQRDGSGAFPFLTDVLSGLK
jgi:hypothetical protein